MGSIPTAPVFMMKLMLNLRILFRNWLDDVRQITWFPVGSVVKYTVLVSVIILISAYFFLLIDSFFGFIVKFLLS